MIRHRILMAIALSLCGWGVLSAEEVPVSHAGSHPRIRGWWYAPDQVLRLRGWVGYHIDLQFESGENFVTLGGGDLEGLTYGAYSNHLVLKPHAPVLRTNLTVFTTKRTYVIDYEVRAGRPDLDFDDLVYSWRFEYPPVPSAPGSVTSLKTESESRYHNTNYWYCGASELQPVAASDDGVHTRLTFAPAAEIPAIFVRNSDGSESLLNYSMEGPEVVIHRLARRLILRRGKTAGCIVNQGFIGSGERLDFGTTSPQVHRSTRESTP